MKNRLQTILETVSNIILEAKNRGPKAFRELVRVQPNFPGEGVGRIGNPPVSADTGRPERRAEGSVTMDDYVSGRAISNVAQIRGLDPRVAPIVSREIRDRGDFNKKSLSLIDLGAGSNDPVAARHRAVRSAVSDVKDVLGRYVGEIEGKVELEKSKRKG